MPIQVLPNTGILRFKDLPFLIYRSTYTNETIPLIENPYFQSLRDNNPSIFNAYYQLQHADPNRRVDYSWDEFLALKENIRLEGWQPNLGADIVIRNFGQLDGAHRLSILCHLYGPDAEVFIINGKFNFPVPADPSKKIDFICEQANKIFLEQEHKIADLESTVDLLKKAEAEPKTMSADLLKETQAEIKTMHDEKRALLNSTSWKMTQPFRRCKDMWFHLLKSL